MCVGGGGGEVGKVMVWVGGGWVGDVHTSQQVQTLMREWGTHFMMSLSCSFHSPRLKGWKGFGLKVFTCKGAASLCR